VTLTFEAIPATVCTIAESPVWDSARGALLWCDIPAGRIFELVLATGARQDWAFPGPVGSFGLAQGAALIVACRHDVLRFDRETGALETLARIEAQTDRTRLNDGKVGPDGAFWVGTMDDTPAKEPVGSLYRVCPDGRVERKLEGLITSNGLAWSADGKAMFHSDSRGRWLDGWDFDARTGRLAARRRIAELSEAQGRPDGGAFDQDGVYWSAGVTAGVLNRFALDGQNLGAVPVPVPAPTMPCFGGLDLKTLFVTSLRNGLSAAALEACPRAGSVFFARVETPGVPITRFGG